MIENSNFHQLRKYEKQQERIRAREEARRKLSLQRTLDSDLLGLEEQQPHKEDSDFFQPGEGGSPLLVPIEEDDEDEVNNDEARKCIRIGSDGQTIELISPQ